MLFILQETDATHINLFIALHLILHVRAAQTQKTPTEKNTLKDARGIFLPIGNNGYMYPCIGRRRYWEPAVSFPLVEGHNL